MLAPAGSVFSAFMGGTLSVLGSVAAALVGLVLADASPAEPDRAWPTPPRRGQRES
jgi:hypothetical protein